MGKKFLKIAIITVLLACVCATVANAYSFTATMTPSSTTVAESKEFSVKVTVSNLDVGTNGINSLQGYFKYDTTVFETINSTSIEGLNGWEVTYNAENGKMTITKTTFVKQEETLFQVILKTKEGTAGKEANISFNTIVASNSEREISTGDINTTIKVVAESTDPINPVANVTTTNPTPIVVTPIANSISNAVTNSTTNNTVSNSTSNVASNNTTTNNAVNNNGISSYVNRTTTNIPSNSDIPYAGVEDTALYILFALIVVAAIFYIKFEKINSDMK